MSTPNLYQVHLAPDSLARRPEVGWSRVHWRFTANDARVKLAHLHPQH